MRAARSAVASAGQAPAGLRPCVARPLVASFNARARGVTTYAKRTVGRRQVALAAAAGGSGGRTVALRRDAYEALQVRYCEPYAVPLHQLMLHTCSSRTGWQPPHPTAAASRGITAGVPGVPCGPALAHRHNQPVERAGPSGAGVWAQHGWAEGMRAFAVWADFVVP